MNEFDILNLGMHVLKIASGATPRGGRENYQESGISLIRSQNVHNFGFVRGGLAYIDQTQASLLNNVEVRSGDILLNITGDSVARVWSVPDDVLPARVNQHVAIIRPDPSVFDAGFLKYFLVSPAIQDRLLALASAGATRPALTKKMIEGIKVWTPNLARQRSIAHILSTLDDKIELNRRMSQTMEEMARTLFTSWFVNFDPVRAKAAGRQPEGMDAETAALFPSEFVNSELGDVPKGWDVRRIGELGSLTIGGDWGQDRAFDDAAEVICLRGVDLEHLRKSGFAIAPRRWIKVGSAQRRAMDERDVLMAGSGAGPTGRPLWVSNDLLTLFENPVVYSNFCKRIRFSSASLAIYVDRHLHEMRESGEIWEYVNGTSVPNLNAASLLDTKTLIVPTAEIMDRFAGIIRTITQRLYAPETRILEKTRDTLVPELLSGRARIQLLEPTL